MIVIIVVIVVGSLRLSIRIMIYTQGLMYKRIGMNGLCVCVVCVGVCSCITPTIKII